MPDPPGFWGTPLLRRGHADRVVRRAGRSPSRLGTTDPCPERWRAAPLRQLVPPGLGTGVQAAGLEGLTFHDLRRANATGLVSAGVDVKTAQTRLGHSSSRLTLDLYAQSVARLDREAAEALGEAFMPEKE